MERLRQCNLNRSCLKKRYVTYIIHIIVFECIALVGEGGAAIFHLYENYVPKYNGDENGLDKVKHFTYSARLCFMKGPTLSFVGGMGVEIGDLLAQQIERTEKLFGRRTKIESTGFDTDDLKANKQGIDYGIELITKYRTFQ